MAKTVEKETKEEVNEVISDFTKEDLILLAECVNTAISGLGDKNPPVTVALLNLSQKVKANIK